MGAQRRAARLPLTGAGSFGPLTARLPALQLPQLQATLSGRPQTHGCGTPHTRGGYRSVGGEYALVSALVALRYVVHATPKGFQSRAE